MSSDDKVITTARISLCTLAECARFLDRQGHRPTTRSELVRQSMDALARAAQTEGLVEPIDSPARAVTILQDYGMSFSDSDVAAKEVAQALSSESLERSTEPDSDRVREVEEILSPDNEE